MYEYMSDFKDVFVMELPNTQSEMALKLWKSELIRFKEYLEKKFDVEITDEAVLEAVKEENKVRKVMKDLYHVMALDPAPIKAATCSKYYTEAASNSIVKQSRQRLNARERRLKKNTKKVRDWTRCLVS